MHKFLRHLIVFLTSVTLAFLLLIGVCRIWPDFGAFLAGQNKAGSDLPALADAGQTDTMQFYFPGIEQESNIAARETSQEASTEVSVQEPAREVPEEEPAEPETPLEESLHEPAEESMEEPVEEPANPEDLEIPEAQAGRNGYQPVQAQNEEIEDNQASLIIEELGHGKTGDDYNFQSPFYPYYAMLDADGKKLYKQIAANAEALITTFKPIVEANSRTVDRAFLAVFNDHPELFWLDPSYTGVYRRNGKCVEIDLTLNATYGDLAGAKDALEQRVQSYLAQAENLPDTYTQEQYVHDRLIDEIEYDLNSDMNQSVYSALVGGRTVCAGYARAFQLIMQRLGIPCFYCAGYAGEDHAWNIIKQGDNYMNVDVTWDDVEDGVYDFYNKSDREFARTHLRREMSIRLPACG